VFLTLLYEQSRIDHLFDRLHQLCRALQRVATEMLSISDGSEGIFAGEKSIIPIACCHP